MKNYLRLILVGLLLTGGAVYAAVTPGFTADSNLPVRLYDKQQLQVHKGVAAINPGGLTWTNYNALLTITPASNFGMINCRVVVDLDKTTSGFATGATSQTITFDVARKVDGTNWRTSQNLETTAISGTNSTGRAIELNFGDVGPNETVALYAKVSSVSALQNVGLPYVLMYRAGTAAVISASN